MCEFLKFRRVKFSIMSQLIRAIDSSDEEDIGWLRGGGGMTTSKKIKEEEGIIWWLFFSSCILYGVAPRCYWIHATTTVSAQKSKGRTQPTNQSLNQSIHQSTNRMCSHSCVSKKALKKVKKLFGEKKKWEQKTFFFFLF